MKTSLSLTIDQQTILKSHLFPQDGKEAVAIVLCGRYVGQDSHRLLAHRIELVPYDYCSIRTPSQVTWSTDILIPLLEQAARRGMGILKIHGHPQGFPQHSEVDDEADQQLFPSIYSWLDDGYPHGSCVMLPNGCIIGRVVNAEGQFEPLTTVKVVGDDLNFWHTEDNLGSPPQSAHRIAQTFGKATFSKLQKLKVAVIGCSGTGSPVIEQLVRLRVGTLVLVDPDTIEEKNLDRILHSTFEDAQRQIPKVDVAKRCIENSGLGTKVITFASNLCNPEVVKAIADCDVVFGCMDSVDGRHLLNRLATFYLIPYFDVGVRLEADGTGGINQVCGGVQYLQPGKSSLLSRGIITLQQLEAVGLKHSNAARYEELFREGYIAGIEEDRPAVISVNMFFASLAVMEFLARLHPYKDDPNACYAGYMVSLSQGQLYPELEQETCQSLLKYVGRGDMVPLLDMPILSLKDTAI
jgi:hypothetical protein